MNVFAASSHVTTRPDSKGPGGFANAARLLPGWRDKTVAASTEIDDEPISITSVTQRAAQCRNMDSEGGRLDN
jgi:hypothetical protein